MAKPVPADQLKSILLPALDPCPHIAKGCAGFMRWEPDNGHVPRGFVGAFGTLEDVEVVIVTAEPGDPLPGEQQAIEGLSSEERLRVICQFTYDQLAGTAPTRADYHANIRYILDRLWPNETLDSQLTKTWVTESVLCSAPESGGDVPGPIETLCRATYLDAQLRALKGRPVLALGGKAQERLAGTFFVDAYHPSATHGTKQSKRAFTSWDDAAKKIRAAVEARRRKVAENGPKPQR